MNGDQAELDRFKRDIDYYVSHQEELLGQYPDKWIAIFDQQVVGSATDFEQLLKDLSEHGIPAERILVEHLSDEKELFILPA